MQQSVTSRFETYSFESLRIKDFGLEKSLSLGLINFCVKKSLSLGLVIYGLKIGLEVYFSVFQTTFYVVVLGVQKRVANEIVKTFRD